MDPSTGKADGMGPLKGGMLFPVSMGMARRLIASMKGGRGAKEAGVVVLEGLGEKMGFEVVVGRNGVVWVDAGGVRGTLAVGRAIQEVDRKGLSVEEQRKLVGKVLRGL